VWDDGAWNSTPPGYARRVEVQEPVEVEKSAPTAAEVVTPPDVAARSAGLPPRPYHDLPKAHYMLSGLRFSSLPEKYRPEIALLPKKLLRPEETTDVPAAAASTKAGHLPRTQSEPLTCKRKYGAGLRSVQCHGDYCNTLVHTPASLQDMENNEHPLIAEAKSLCKRHLQQRPGQPLLLPEEMAAVAEAVKSECRAQSTSATQQRPSGYLRKDGVQFKQINLSWILEARAHPSLSKWLELEQGWMLSPDDEARVGEAMAKIKQDADLDRPPDGLAQVGLPGMRYKLQEVPVCNSCWCAYNVIRSTLTICRRKPMKHAPPQRKAAKTEVMSRDRESMNSSIPGWELPRSNRVPQSLFLDPQVEAWLHNPLFDVLAASATSEAQGKKGGGARDKTAWLRRKSCFTRGDLGDIEQAARLRSSPLGGARRESDSGMRRRSLGA